MAMDPTFTNTDRATSLSSGAHDTGLYDPALHDNQIVAMYDTLAHANAARDSLVAAGVAASSIQVVDQSSATGMTTGSTTTEDEGIWGSIKSLFAPDDDLHGYAEGVRRGHAVLTVTPSGQADRSHIIDVLESTNPVDFDAKLEEWRQAGYTGHSTAIGAASGMAAGAGLGMATDARSPTLTGSTATTATMPTAAAGLPGVSAPRTGLAGAALTDADTIKVMEERLRVGKREVARGAVRVRSYVVERPVEEQVTLHDERVTLERHPVDRAVTAADEAAFRERTIEVRATGEEAVVAKDVRVVEEIGIRKDATDRVETVRDTVRRTEVEVDDNVTDVATGATSVTGATTATSGATTSGTNAPRK